METETEPTEEQFVEDVQQETHGGGTTTTQTTQTTEPKPLSQGDLDAAFEKLGTTLKTAVTPPREAPQMSEADQKKLWSIYDPEESQKDFMRKFFRLNPEATKEEEQEARAMFKGMQEGLVRQSIVGARNLFQMELAKLREEFAPLQQHYRDAQAEKLQTEFFKSYPSLAAQDETSGSFRYMTAIRMAAQDLAQQTFASRPIYFKALADRAAEIVKGILPDFSLGATPPKKSSTSTPSLPRTRVGGSGGTARGGDTTTDGKAVRGANGDDASTLDWTAAT
jgi:hypothetical protein